MPRRRWSSQTTLGSSRSLAFTPMRRFEGVEKIVGCGTQKGWPYIPATHSRWSSRDSGEDPSAAGRVTRIPLLGACLPRVPFPLRTIGFLAILLRAGKRRPTVSQRSSRMTKSGTVSSHCLWRGAKNAIFKAGLMALRFMEPTATYWTLFFRESSNKRQSGPYAGTTIDTPMPTHLRCHQKRLRCRGK
ncbi:hypothetical protein TcBrA4_0070080 [Trypanosoma cruzi]|nr:hypothetical protein TcBrA4_0070080 [Trypanosoma cruzi]